MCLSKCKQHAVNCVWLSIPWHIVHFWSVRVVGRIVWSLISSVCSDGVPFLVGETSQQCKICTTFFDFQYLPKRSPHWEKIKKLTTVPILSPVPAMFALLVIAVSFVVNKRYIHEWTPTSIVCHRMRFGCTLEPDSIQCLFRNFSQTKLKLPNSLVRSGANLYFVLKFNAIAVSMQHRSYSNVYRHTIHDFGEIQRIACWHKNISERVI